MTLIKILVAVIIAALVAVYIWGVYDKWQREKQVGHRHRFIHLVDPFTEVTHSPRRDDT